MNATATKPTEQAPEVIRNGVFSCQVCVPESYTDDEVKSFADTHNLCGTENGWFVRDENPDGSPKRVACSERKGFVHLVLDA